MNKQELSAKWSKYCNTNNLVDDARALLKRYGHVNTEKGVCALLDKYFTNKEPLIKMFATSPHYIGNMRIAVEREFERTINMNEVRNFFTNVSAKFYLNELLQDKDADGKTLFDYLQTGKSTLSTDSLPTDEQQTIKRKAIEKFDLSTFSTTESVVNLDDFIRYCNYFASVPTHSLTQDWRYSFARNSPVLKKGTKTSRAFNSVCAHYGVDKLHPEEKVVNGVKKIVYPYNKLFAEYSDLVSDLTRKMHFVISLNPLDYLTMSNGVNWISCHNISHGGYMGGTLSYMLDKVSMITFVVEKLDGSIHEIPKVYRQMYHYENNLFVQSRLYPQGNDGATNLYDKFRGFVIEEFTELLGADSEWKTKVGNRECCKHIYTASGSTHYPDYGYNSNASIFYPANNEPSVINHVMTIGHKGICVNCGKEYSRSGGLAHAYRSDCL